MAQATQRGNLGACLLKQLNPNFTVLAVPSRQPSGEGCVSRRPVPIGYDLLTGCSSLEAVPHSASPLLSKVNTLAPSRNADSLPLRVLRERLGESLTPLMVNLLECGATNTNNYLLVCSGNAHDFIVKVTLKISITTVAFPCQACCSGIFFFLAYSLQTALTKDWDFAGKR